MALFWEMSFFTSDNNIGKGQGSLFINHTDHQCNTSVSNNASIHSQHYFAKPQAVQQRLGIWQIKNRLFDIFINEPAFYALFNAGYLNPKWGLTCNLGKLGALAPYDTADHASQGIQISSEVTFWLGWIESFQCISHLAIPIYVVGHANLPIFNGYITEGE